MAITQRITPNLWFNLQAEEAVRFYTGIFPNSRITGATHYGEAGREFHGMEPGTVLTLSYELDGLAFVAINGGPHFQFTEAISLQVLCETQDEVDYYWERLLEGGGVEQPCGWLKDRFGLSWQVVPVQLQQWMSASDGESVHRMSQALFQMRKLNIAALERAFRGE